MGHVYKPFNKIRSSVSGSADRYNYYTALASCQKEEKILLSFLRQPHGPESSLPEDQEQWLMDKGPGWASGGEPAPSTAVVEASGLAPITLSLSFTFSICSIAVPE